MCSVPTYFWWGFHTSYYTLFMCLLPKFFTYNSPTVPYVLVPKATHTAGTPPQVCGRSWESIIIPYVCYCGERTTVRSNGCIYRSDCCNTHAHKGSHQLFGFLFWQVCYSGHHGDAHYIALLFSHISFVLKISYIRLSRNMGKIIPPSIYPDFFPCETERDLEKTF